LLLRLILFVLLIYLLLLVIKHAPRSRRGNRVAPPIDDMALDPQCQSYIPKRDAVQRGGNFFCSQECAERYLTR
jgi:hypothetical protein